MDRSCLMYDENQRSSLCSTSHFWTWAAPQRRRKEAKSRRLNSHTITLFFPAGFFSKLTYTMCRTYIVYTCTSPLPSPFSPFLHKVYTIHFTKCFCQHGAGSSRTKRPLPSSSEGVRRDEELVLALNAKSITPSMSAASSSSVSSATPNFRKPQYKYHQNVFPKFE